MSENITSNEQQDTTSGIVSNFDTPRASEINGRTWPVIGVEEYLRNEFTAREVAMADYEQKVIWFDRRFRQDLIYRYVARAISFARKRDPEWGRWNDLEIKPLKLAPSGRPICPCCGKDYVDCTNMRTHLISVHLVPQRTANEIVWATTSHKS